MPRLMACSHSADDPASRFRIMQYVPHLAAAGWQVSHRPNRPARHWRPRPDQPMLVVAVTLNGTVQDDDVENRPWFRAHLADTCPDAAVVCIRPRASRHPVIVGCGRPPASSLRIAERRRRTGPG